MISVTRTGGDISELLNLRIVANNKEINLITRSFATNCTNLHKFMLCKENSRLFMNFMPFYIISTKHENVILIIP